jgi:hypothetical protein
MNKFSALLLSSLLVGCTFEGGGGPDEDILVDEDCVDCQPSQLQVLDVDTLPGVLEEPEDDPEVCTDDCGDGLVYLCETPHYPFAHPKTICIEPEDSEAYTIGSYGYCGICPPEPPCPETCGEGSLEGQVVCRDNFGEQGGPETVCMQGPLSDGDSCGACELSKLPPPE